MNAVGSVGPWEFVWKTIPRGASGQAQVEVREKGTARPARLIDIRWRRDADGLWLELPSGVHGFDLQGESGDDGRTVFEVSRRNGHEFWRDLAYLHSGEEQAAAGGRGAHGNVRVRAQMPGKILRIHVTEGAQVDKGQPIMVMEAMKMENEIKASQAGRVGQVKVIEGQAVETGADLCEIKP